MKLKYFFLLLLTLLIVNSSLLIGTVRYVSKTGTSIPPYTSWQTAADSIQKCINICVDGDTIYVANGVYKENLVINTAISLIGSSMDSTVIDGRGLSGNKVIELLASIELQNFNLIGKGVNIPSYSIFSINNNISARFCRISNSWYGLAFGNCSPKMKDFIISNTKRAFESECPSDTCNSELEKSLIIYNGNSFNAVSFPFGGNTYLCQNIIFNELGNEFSTGIEARDYVNLTIQNNLILGFGGQNMGITQLADTAVILNNISSYSNGIGFKIDNGLKTTLNNNISLRNGTGVKSSYGLQINKNYNLFWNNDNNLQGVAISDSDIVADPMFVNDTVPTANGNYDFHLQKYSPAIDKGDPSILDVDGSRSDIGMFGGPLGESYTYQDLAPKPPRNLTASMDSGLVHLKWNKNTEADLFRYRVYRDTVPDFIYDTTKIIAVIPDTTFYDDPPQKFISGNYYYKITAIDSAYNQSPASEEAHINITGIPEAPPIVVEHFNLLQNYPNPFNPSTTIPYRLKAPGYVKVMVYNLLGEQVKVLVNKYQSAGYYEVLFHPTATERQSAEGKIEFETGYGDIVSGIYLYRIEVIGEGNIPVFTDMKKMMMVK